MQSAAIGIDIGGTFTKIGLVGKSGETFFADKFPSYANEPFEIFTKQLYQKLKEIQDLSKDKWQIEGIGVGAPDAQPFLGIMLHPPNLKGWGDRVPIVQAIKNFTDIPTFLTNDANAAALGEMYFGIAKGLKNFLVLTLGTGLGSGIVVNGKLMQGQQGMAGEMGHLVVKADGRKCVCGKTGCLETYASVTGIKRTVAKLMADLPIPSTLRDIPYNKLDGLQITQAALNGDVLAQTAFTYTGEILGMKLADAVAYFNPEAIILSGGLSKAGDILINPTRECMEKHLFPAFKGTVKLMVSQTEHANAAVGGAAALVWEQLSES